MAGANSFAVATEKLCWTWAAAAKVGLPAWLARSVQVPIPWKVTSPALMEQIALEAGATVIVTARPEVEDAVGV